MENSEIKICQVANTDMAIRFLLLNQLIFLKKEGYNVQAVCSPGELIKDIKDIKIKTINFNRGFNVFAHLISFFRLYFYFKKEKFDIVHTHNPVPGFLGQLTAKAAGVPLIVNTIHGFYFNDESSFFQRKFFVFIERIAAKCSGLIFSQNKEDIKTAIREKICPLEKIKYLGNGIDVQRFNPERFPETFIKEKKRKLGLNPDFKIVGIVGRLVEEKGYLELFEAFKMVLNKFPKTMLLVVGPEESKKKDRIKPELIRDYGIESNVLFLGQRTDIEEIYPLFDIFVLPSHREGFPRTVIEAQAMKKPVITTDIRGCREAVENQKTGILIPLRNPDRLSKAIIYLFDNPKVAEYLAENARKKVIEEFDERLIFNRIKTEYQKLIKENIWISD